MTKQRIERLKSKIEESRERLMQSNPFFSIMLMYLRYVAVYSVDRISTDGTAIYFSPDFLDKLYGYEMDYVLCHQILHIILGHCFAPLETVDDNIHLAFDIKVNGLLYMLGFQRERYPHLGDIQRKYRGSEQRASEAKVKDIYENLSFSLYVIEEKSRRNFFVTAMNIGALINIPIGNRL